jgi:hypothetical protein
MTALPQQWQHYRNDGSTATTGAALQQQWQHCHNDDSTATTMEALPHRCFHCYIDESTHPQDDSTTTRCQYKNTQNSRTMKHNHMMTAQLHYDKQSSIDERTTTR